MDDAEPMRAGRASVEEMRRVFDFFMDILIRTMALQAAAVENDATLEARIQRYCKVLRDSEVVQKARRDLAAVDAEVLLKLLQEFQGPIQ
jgi:hypothetical protein